ncbi:co-chaperone GroES [Epidermidibacterium keratini]|uniref:10 kDa chaperonin n=2 Tax=Epidermidibacterium keratini TaxID=1891644 RepID=A0A7L4YNA8_9ACTN|nr:co-chaperone GroES [Epidermidibacterium keratini]
MTYRSRVANKDSGLPIMMLHDRLLVKLNSEDGDRKSSGGILIPATAKVARRLRWGEVLGAGPSVRNVKVGDQVLFGEDDDAEVEINAESYTIMRERDVHAVAAERVEVSTGLYL